MSVMQPPNPPPSTTVILEIPRHEAEEISEGLADLLCWCCGFVAALPEELSRHPLNWEVAREIRLKLMAALGNKGREIPF